MSRLRTALLIVAAAVFAVGLLGCASGHPGGMPAALWGGVLLAAIVFERWRYRRATAAPGVGWIATEERFVDPETGHTLQVWYEPRTGARRYVDAAPPPGRDIPSRPPPGAADGPEWHDTCETHPYN